MNECIYCRTTCNNGESPCQTRDEAERCAWFTESDRRALSVSDEQPKAEDRDGLSPQGASAVGNAETPLPIHVAGIVERLEKNAQTVRLMTPVLRSMGYRSADGMERLAIGMDEAATALQSLSQSLAIKDSEIEALEEQCAKLATQNALASVDKVLLEDRAEAAEAEIERLTAERDEARRQEALCRSDGNVEIGLRKSAEARIAEMEKALEQSLRAMKRVNAEAGVASRCSYEISEDIDHDVYAAIKIAEAALARQGAKP